jgi:hypothetical protein
MRRFATLELFYVKRPNSSALKLLPIFENEPKVTACKMPKPES